MTDELPPITEADVVPGAEFTYSGLGAGPVRVLAVGEGWVMYRWLSTGHVVADPLDEFVDAFRKPALKSPRYVVEKRPPKKGERFLDRWGRVLVARCDFTTDRAVIVEELS